MLGFHRKLRHDLEKNGQRALAKVREAKRTRVAFATGNAPADQVADQKVLWKLVVQVEPDGQEPFEAKVEEMLSYHMNVEPSERHYRFAVLYDPSDHSKVLIDQSDEGERMLEVSNLKERTDAQVGRMRERGQGFWADRVQAANDSLGKFMSQDDSQLSADEREDARDAQRQKMRDIMAGDSAQRAEQIRAIQLDASIPPDQKRARIMALMAGMGAPTANMVVRGEPIAGGRSSDAATTADALTKLADLHDRGVLTDDEFEKQKQKLLGE
jgi:Short C-terminal domain